MLANPNAIQNVEEDFLKLQESKATLQSPSDEELFEDAVEQLRARWHEVKGKIAELQPRMQIMMENFSDYKEKLRSVVVWVQRLEKLCQALDNVQDYIEFQPLMENFQVRFS